MPEVANPVKGEVALDLPDGRHFTLVADYEALIAAEGAYGRPLPHLLEDAKAAFTGAIRALLYGTLRAHHPAVTLGEAAALFMENDAAVSAALSAALEMGFPAADGGAEGEKRPRPRGKSSGASGAKRALTPRGSGAPRRARS